MSHELNNERLQPCDNWSIFAIHWLIEWPHFILSFSLSLSETIRHFLNQITKSEFFFIILCFFLCFHRNMKGSGGQPRKHPSIVIWRDHANRNILCSQPSFSPSLFPFSCNYVAEYEEERIKEMYLFVVAMTHLNRLHARLVASPPNREDKIKVLTFSLENI